MLFIKKLEREFWGGWGEYRELFVNYMTIYVKK